LSTTGPILSSAVRCHVFVGLLLEDLKPTDAGRGGANGWF
jgi:hypothetical protein